MHARRWVLVATAATLALAPAAEAKRTGTVWAGEPNPKAMPKQTIMNSFYPRTVTVNRGQSVNWKFTFFHTVTFLSGRAQPPLVLPDASKPYPPQNDAAGNPFWWAGQPAIVFHPIAARRTSAAYAGAGVRNSGLPPGRSWKLKFNKTGTFRYVCLVHPGMKAKVRVVAKRARVPSRRADARTANSQFRADLATLKRQIRSGGPGGSIVLLGHDSGAATLLRMVPAATRIATGGSVTFRMDGLREDHTVTFGSAAYRKEVAREFERGTPQLPFPALGPRGTLPSDPPPLPDFDGANHGNGFLNTGILDQHPESPPPSEVTIKFTRAGTYEYECMVHPGMKGTIVVQ